MDLDATAILAATTSGHTARVISRFRPACPIVALTTSEKVRRQLAISWGVQPLLYGSVDSTDRLFSLCVETARKEGVAAPGDTVVITAGVPLSSRGTTNLIKAQIVAPPFKPPQKATGQGSPVNFIISFKNGSGSLPSPPLWRRRQGGARPSRPR